MVYSLSMIEYVQIPVPKQLVPAVFRGITEYLEGAGEIGDSADKNFLWRSKSTLGMYGSWEQVATENEGQGAYGWWHDWLRPAERELLKVLAKAPAGRLSAPDAAKELGMTSQDLAGVIGPLNRRLARDGFPEAIQSQLTTTADPSKRRRKELQIEPTLAEIVKSYGEAFSGDASKTPRVKKRARSQAAIDIFGPRRVRLTGVEPPRSQAQTSSDKPTLRG
jgi:hypothetical protein